MRGDAVDVLLIFQHEELEFICSDAGVLHFFLDLTVLRAWGPHSQIGLLGVDHRAVWLAVVIIDFIRVFFLQQG
jgi:hypothetical protein